MKMFQIGDIAIRISRITAVQRPPLERGSWKLIIYTPEITGGIQGKYDTERERDNVYNALIDAIEEGD